MSNYEFNCLSVKKAQSWTQHDHHFLFLYSLWSEFCIFLSLAHWIFCAQMVSLPVLPMDISCKIFPYRITVLSLILFTIWPFQIFSNTNHSLLREHRAWSTGMMFGCLTFKGSPNPTLVQGEEKAASSFSCTRFWSSVNPHQSCDPEFEEKLLTAQKQDMLDQNLVLNRKCVLLSSISVSKYLGGGLFFPCVMMFLMAEICPCCQTGCISKWLCCVDCFLVQLA